MSMIDQVQSRDACERGNTVEVPADLLCSEIDAASVTIVMAKLLCLRALEYRGVIGNTCFAAVDPL
jgi:hypothetical protein